MALLWADGFDHYGNTNIFAGQSGYSLATANGAWDIQKNNPRTGNYSIYVHNDGYAASCVVQKAIAATGFNVGMGIAIFLQQSGNYGLGLAQSFGNYQVYLVINNDGSISAFKGDGTLIGSSAAGAFIFNTYSYVELSYVGDRVNGQVAVRVNNALVYSVDGINSVSYGNGEVTAFGFGKMTNGYPNVTNAWDDLVAWDSSGPTNNAFMGDVRCRTIFAEANGVNQDWQTNGLPDAWNCIAQVPPQPGVDFISAANAGDVSSFDMQAVPANTGAIHGIMLHMNLNKADAGNCTVEGVIGSQGKTLSGPPINPGTAPAYYSAAFDQDPNGVNWTKDTVNGLNAVLDRVQ